AAISSERLSGTASATLPVTWPRNSRRARKPIPSRRGRFPGVTGSPKRYAKSARTSEKTRSAAALDAGSIVRPHHVVHHPSKALRAQRLAEISLHPLDFQRLDGARVA